MLTKTLVFTAILSSVPVFALLPVQTNDSLPVAESGSVQPESIEPLRPFNALIGEWRGVGQLKRGSNRGAWSEKVLCEWSFTNGRTSISLKADRGKQFAQMTLTWDTSQSELVLTQQSDETRRSYRGKMPDRWPGTLSLLTEANAEDEVYRCTIQQLSEIRATLLFEKKSSATGSFRRVAGVGYTRAGQKLAEPGGNQRKCVVTGGLGTIAVSHKGKTYYVCCQGCVQAFNAAPDEIIADYQASLKKK